MDAMKLRNGRVIYVDRADLPVEVGHSIEGKLSFPQRMNDSTGYLVEK